MIKPIKIFLFLCLAFAFTAKAQKEETPPKTTRILLILDASGSMTDKWEGHPRMDIAKDILSKLVDSLRTEPNLELALRVYGHQWDKRYNNCKDTKLEVPFKKGNFDAIKAKIKTIEPKGTTLIANALKHAADDFPDDKNSRNVIILITDGIEACGGDPCALSLALQKKRIFLKPFIIGIGADDNFAKAFSCMGQYFDAKNVQEFRSNLHKIFTQTLKETTVVVNLLDEKDRPTETDVNMSFINTVTGETEYDFIHFIKPDGKSDRVKIDAILTYNIVVNTIPNVIKENVGFEGGKENVVNIKTPQGALYIRDKHKEYKNLIALVHLKNNSEILNVQDCGKKQKYLIGNYDVDVLTLPIKSFKGVEINQSQTTTLVIAPPGILNISESIEGFGSLYEVKENGEHQWIYNFPDENSKIQLPIQPGNYKFVFRSKKTRGSEFTDVQFFTIKSGATILLKPFSK